MSNLKLRELKVEELDFEKQNGLIPTIIQEQNGNILSLVYSNKESIEKTLKTKRVWSFSRSRKGVFQKGATSGNTQELVEFGVDCDNDSILIIVKQNGSCACHTGSYSCFGGKEDFTLNELYLKLSSRLKNAPSGSYTKKLFKDDLLLKRKLIEEAAEVITAKDKENLIFECSDLIYFLLVIMAKEGVTISDIEKENKRRDEESESKKGVRK